MIARFNRAGFFFYFLPSINMKINLSFYLFKDEDLANSALIMLLNMFSDPKTSDFFFQNDLNVLVDVLTQRLKDLPEDSPV